MAQWLDGELYIIESQDGWYWPTHGIQKTKFDDWIKEARDADFHVSWMKLNKEQRAKYDEKKAAAFFKEMEGLPYGYHNMLFSWLDTPYNNLPPVLPGEFLMIAFSVLDRISPKMIDTFVGQALNKRLGTKGLDFRGLATEAAR